MNPKVGSWKRLRKLANLYLDGLQKKREGINSKIRNDHENITTMPMKVKDYKRAV